MSKPIKQQTNPPPLAFQIYQNMLQRNATPAGKLFILLNSLLMPLSSYAETHCKQDEGVVFSCKIKGSQKVASLCASFQTTNNAKKATALAYRFGKVGNPELQFPSTSENSLRKFEFSHYYRPGLESTGISFKTSGFLYSIYETTNGDSSSPKQKPIAGLSVSSLDKTKGAELTCEGDRVTSDWSIIDGVVPCEEEDGTPNTCDYRHP